MMGLSKKHKAALLLILAFMCSFTSGVGFAQSGDREVNQNLYKTSNILANTLQSINEGQEGLETAADDGSPPPVPKQQGKLLTLQEAIKMAEQNNPDILTVSQDVYMRKQDVEKAHYYAEKLRDVKKDADLGEEMLKMINQQLAMIPDPDDPVYKPTYDYLIQQKEIIENKLEEAAPYTNGTYENGKILELYEAQAKMGLNITTIGQKVAVQKISLLVSKEYFDAVKYQKLADMKKTAMDRAQAQEKAAKASYDAGFRAKDDYLLAKAQSELMRADYESAQMNVNNALIELKATIGMDQDTAVRLSPWNETKMMPDQSKGLEQGLKKRLEIQKAQGELDIANLNLKIAKEYLGPGAVDYEQARISTVKAQIELQRQKYNVEKDIRQAYQSLLTTNKMSEGVKDTVASARESASIAEYRYREGFSIPSPIMKALNAEDLAGTTVEVLAAQEKLMDVEEKVIEIEYNNNLAKVNYLVCIGEGL